MKKIESKYINLDKRLRGIKSDQEDNFQEYGTRVFGFGYPIIVIKLDNNKKIKSPLIIWNLTLETHKVEKKSYYIKKRRR